MRWPPTAAPGQMLAEELGIEPGEELRQLEEAVLRQEVPPPATAAVTRTLPRDIASFTGRGAELGRLLGDLAGAAAGGGWWGSARSAGWPGSARPPWRCTRRTGSRSGSRTGSCSCRCTRTPRGSGRWIPPMRWPACCWRPGSAPGRSRPALEARAARWRDYLAGKKVLLVLDDAAGHEQVRPLLPGTAGSLVLITSRRRLAALEDAAVISLDTLAPGEAAALLARLAGRPGLDAGDAGVGEITRLCGYLPLAIGMLASQLHQHPAWTTAGLAAQLAAARDRLELMHAENLSVAAAFDLSYQDLPADQQRLFRRLGLHPGPDIDAYAAAALDGTTAGRCPPRPGGPLRPAPAHRARPGPLPAARPAPRTRPGPRRRRRPRRLRGCHRPAAGLLPAHRAGRQQAHRHAAPSPAALRRPPGHRPARRRYPHPSRQPPGWRTERANLHAAAGYAAAARTPPARHRDPRRDGRLPGRSGPLGSGPPPSTRPPWPRRARPVTGPARPAP